MCLLFFCKKSIYIHRKNGTILIRGDNKMLKKMLVAGLFGVSVFSSSIASAEYIVAHEETYYEKYVIDTQSIFQPKDKNNELRDDEFNVLVWRYTDPNGEKKPTAYVYKFKCGNDERWKVFTKKDNDDEGSYKKIEKGSLAHEILVKSLPYVR